MEEKKTKKVLYGHSGVVNCLIITDKNILISGSADTTIKIWTSQVLIICSSSILRPPSS